MKSTTKLSTLIGKSIERIVIGYGEYKIEMFDTDGNVHSFSHDRYCCEQVAIDSIDGDINDLIGSEIIMAEEVESDESEFKDREKDCEVFTWTFYKFATQKGYVTIRWLGDSNGAYSTEVDYSFNGKRNWE